jgi:hypothetical protein
MRRTHAIAAAAAAVVASSTTTATSTSPQPSFLHAPASFDPAPYAIWAHSHFVWLDSTRSNEANVTSFVASFLAHNITVGAVDIDSGWSTGFNDFVVDTAKFPTFPSLVSSLHAQGMRVILWMTSMVDTDSSNYNAALANDYFIRNGFNQSAMLSWWHGTGGLLDYSNPKARAWWEGQLDLVLRLPGNASIDGWKCDGTDPYIIELLTPLAHQGPITYQEYANFYYGHTFNYSRAANPEALIWSRPVDSPSGLLPFNLSVFLAYSPRYVMFSGWVGDQDPTFDGLRAAAINILESAWQNYTNFASDTGGYRGGAPRTRELFLRWSQLNAFLPLFENGGDDEHRPWAFDNPAAGDTTASDVYRRLVAAHYELAPYLLTTGSDSYAAGISSIRPTSSPPVDFPFIIQPDDVTDWSYALGATVFASPVLYENVTAQPVTLPTTAAAAGYYDFFNPSSTFPAGANISYPVPLTGVPATQMTTPVFVAQGSVLPLHVSTPYGLFPQADDVWSAALTLTVQDVGVGESQQPNPPLRLRDASGGLEVSVAAELADPGAASSSSARVSASAYGRPLIVAFRWAGRRFSSRTDAVSVRVRTRDGIKTPSRRPAVAPRLVDEAGRMTTAHLALAFDATAPGGGRYPIDGLHERVQADFARRLAGTFTATDGGVGFFDGVEVLVFVGMEDAEGGVDVEVDF